MKSTIRKARDRAILGLRGAPPGVIRAYRDALEQAGVDRAFLDAYGTHGLAALRPHEHRRLLAAGQTRQFSPSPRAAVDRGAKRPRMLLHVGAVKTGSTATQLAMHADRARLWDNGVLYPAPVAFFGARNYDSHNGIVAPLSRANASRDPSLAAFRRYITGLSASAELTVISSERLYGATDGEDALVDAGQWGASYWPRRRRFVEKLAEYVSDFDVTPILWLRSPDALADSLYREFVKANLTHRAAGTRRYNGSFADFCESAGPLWDYDQQVGVLEEAFGKVVVHRFEDDDIIGTIYKHLEVTPPPASADRRANTSADGRVVLWLKDCPDGGTRQRQAFGVSPEAIKALREGTDGSLWESEDARAGFLAALPNTIYGPDYFPTPAPLAASARLTRGDAARLSAAFDAWRERHPEEEFLQVPASERRASSAP